MQNYFKGSKENPYHLSIGAVLINEDNLVCCHYFNKVSVQYQGEYKDFYILMRETIKSGEKIEEALHRGLMEEFGATGEIVTYVGSQVGSFRRQGVDVEKTTLYFLVKCKSFDPKLRVNEDVESESEIQWQNPDFLIEKMKQQGNRFKEKTLDESEILERVKRLGLV